MLLPAALPQSLFPWANLPAVALQLKCFSRGPLDTVELAPFGRVFPTLTFATPHLPPHHGLSRPQLASKKKNHWASRSDTRSLVIGQETHAFEVPKGAVFCSS